MTLTSSDPLHRPAVLWRQVIGLGLLQGAISLVWVIYNLYLAKLLVQMGLPETLATTLLIVENGAAVILEPLMGGLADQTRHWVGSRFPLIAVGVILSAALFAAMPNMVIFGSPTAFLQGLLIGIVLLWAMAMTVFRSPAISLLGQYANIPTLPLAASILTLMSGLVSAIRPLCGNFLLQLNPALVFMVGSIALLAGATALRWVDPPDPQAVNAARPPLRPFVPALALIFGFGMVMAGSTRLLLGEVLPLMLRQSLANATNLSTGIGLSGLLLAWLAIPAGWLGTRIDNRRAIALGVGAAIALLGLLAFLANTGATGGAIVLFGWSLLLFFLLASMSLVINGAIPLGLSLLPSSWGGLSIGTYFGGFSAAMSLMAILIKPGMITLHQGCWLTMLALLLVGMLVILSWKLPRIIRESNPAAESSEAG